LGEHVSSAGPEGLVGLPHEVWRGNVRSGWGGGVKYKGKACKPLL